MRVSRHDRPVDGDSMEGLLRQKAREWWSEIAAEPDDPSVLQTLPLVTVHADDPASLENLRVLLEEAPDGTRLAVETPEWDWPRVERIATTAKPVVRLHWAGGGWPADEKMPAPAPFEDPGLYPPFLHRWVWQAAAPRWETGQYRQGVLDAYMSVEEWTRRKLGSHESGDRLYCQAFTIKDGAPRLRFTSVTSGTDEWNNRHRAAMLLGQAITAGFRNWAAHTTRPQPAQVAIEYLATLSVLARWVDEATCLAPAPLSNPVTDR